MDDEDFLLKKLVIAAVNDGDHYPDDPEGAVEYAIEMEGEGEHLKKKAVEQTAETWERWKE